MMYRHCTKVDSKSWHIAGVILFAAFGATCYECGRLLWWYRYMETSTVMMMMMVMIIDAVFPSFLLSA